MQRNLGNIKLKCSASGSLFRPVLKKVLGKIGLDVHLPCHVSKDQKNPFNTAPEFFEILASAK